MFLMPLFKDDMTGSLLSDGRSDELKKLLELLFATELVSNEFNKCFSQAEESLEK